MNGFLEESHVILIFIFFYLLWFLLLLRLLLFLFLLILYWGSVWSKVIICGGDRALSFFYSFGAVDGRARDRGYDLAFLIGLPVERIDEHSVTAG